MKRLLYSCRYKTNIAVVRRQGFGQGDEVFFFFIVGKLRRVTSIHGYFKGVMIIVY